MKGDKVHPIVVQAQGAFEEAFGGQAELLVQAPGRVNLIGEHTDYNDGFVFPVAIDRWVVLAVRPREDKRIRVFSGMHNEMAEYDLTGDLAAEKHWSDYGKGVIREFQKLGHSLCGFDAAVVGDVPMGAGLSSSAAVEMAVGKTLMELNGIELSGPDLALLGQRAENQFVGVNCGIMDQFISANGKAGHALFLDCRDLSYDLVPLARDGVRIVICNSGVTRGLTDSAYNDRRSACESGARHLALATGEDITALRDVSMDMLEAYRGALSEKVLKRCRHVIAENQRTQDAVALLQAGDVSGFGELMDASHISLRDDYDVSGDELDILVGIAHSVPGVLGARMTGAGFGGCTVNLVEADAVDTFMTTVNETYPKLSKLTPEIYVCSAVNGAERIE
ncbi:MAG: galactokinase [Candidatus Latescibacteria bacterium]|jgi:galactokinase|nr:galactokinase [Candidatus Latescibacterota bacterium]